MTPLSPIGDIATANLTTGGAPTEILTWETASDWDGDVDRVNMADESVTGTDHTDATLTGNGYPFEGLTAIYPTLYGSDLTGWWPLHRTFGDAVDIVSGNHGTVNGATRGVWGRGGLQAYSFDGSDDYISTTTDAFPTATGGVNISFCAWIKQTTKSSGHNVFGAQDEYSFHIEDGNLILRTFGGNTGDSGTNIGAGAWHHIGFEWDVGTDARLYLDGSQVHETALTDTSGDSGSAWWIGARNAGSPHHWDGEIADVRIYSTALTSAQIQTLYEFGNLDVVEPPDSDDGGVSYYPFSSSGATDAWGSNDGTVNGATYLSSGGPRGDGAYSFDGMDDSISVPVDVGTLGSFSVCAWFNIASSSSNFIYGSSDGTNQQNLDVDPNNEIRFQTYDGSTTYGIGKQSLGIQNGLWYHVVATYDTADGYKLFLNGVHEATSGDTTFVSDSTNDDIGRRGGDGNFPFTGEIDDVRIYDTALSPAEIAQVYRYGTFGRDLRDHTVRA